MRVEEEASGVVVAVGRRWYVVVGKPRQDGLVACHLLSDEVVMAACVVVLDLTGSVREVHALVADEGMGAAMDVVGFTAVPAATWRSALAKGVRSQLKVWQDVERQAALEVASAARQSAFLRRLAFALESGQADLQPELARLAPSWTGTIPQMYQAARSRVNGRRGGRA